MSLVSVSVKYAIFKQAIWSLTSKGTYNIFNDPCQVCHDLSPPPLPSTHTKLKTSKTLQALHLLAIKSSFRIVLVIYHPV